MKNCRVLFSGAGDRVLVVEKLSLEEAIQFALNLHRSSNVNHLIEVERVEGSKVDLVVSFHNCAK